MDLLTTKAYAGPNHLTAGIQHGSWSMPMKAGTPPQISFLSSNQQEVREDLNYTTADIEAVIEWTKRHVETTWHSLGVSINMSHRERPSLTFPRPAAWRHVRATKS